MTLPLGPNSLRWRLTKALTLVQGVILFLINIAFIGFLMTVLPMSAPADRMVIPAIAQSIAERSGRLIVVPSDDLTALVRNNPGFWFRAIDGLGRETAFGRAPSELGSLLEDLSNVAYIDLRWRNQPTLTVATANTESNVGRIQIIFGGRPETGSPFWNFVAGLKVIYLPFTIIPMLAALFAVPFVVRRAFKGVEETAKQAAGIDLQRRGEQLSLVNVVDEIRPLVNAINAAFQRVDEGYEKRRRFLANAAHELRTPIAVLQTRIETIQHSPERERLLLDIKRLAATAEQLLNMQRLDHDGLHLTPVDIVAICRQVVADLAPLAIEHGYDLSFTAARPTIFVQGHTASLWRALTNLLMNAIEHSGVSGRIAVLAFEDGCIDVVDEGLGIPEAHRQRIFEPFYRVEPKTHGAGLGLTLVQEIANRHLGTVTLVHRDKGAHFRFRLRPVHHD